MKLEFGSRSLVRVSMLMSPCEWPIDVTSKTNCSLPVTGLTTFLSLSASKKKYYFTLWSLSTLACLVIEREYKYSRRSSYWLLQRSFRRDISNDGLRTMDQLRHMSVLDGASLSSRPGLQMEAS